MENSVPSERYFATNLYWHHYGLFVPHSTTLVLYCALAWMYCHHSAIGSLNSSAAPGNGHHSSVPAFQGPGHLAVSGPCGRPCPEALCNLAVWGPYDRRDLLAPARGEGSRPSARLFLQSPDSPLEWRPSDRRTPGGRGLHREWSPHDLFCLLAFLAWSTSNGRTRDEEMWACFWIASSKRALRVVRSVESVTVNGYPPRSGRWIDGVKRPLRCSNPLTCRAFHSVQILFTPGIP